MGIIHIVLIGFAAECDPAIIQDMCNRMLALKDNCISSTTKKSYIKSLIGGQDNSFEMLQKGVSHAFIVEFETEEDRDYYIREDPAHEAFVKGLKALQGQVKLVQVVDFTPDQF